MTQDYSEKMAAQIDKLESGGETRTHCGKYLFLYSRSNAGPWRYARVIVSLDDDDDDQQGAA